MYDIKVSHSMAHLTVILTIYETYSRPGVLNLLVLVYPQIKIVPLCIPPNQNCIPLAYTQIKNSTQISFISVGFLILRIPVGSSRTPCVPQVDNRYSRPLGQQSEERKHNLFSTLTYLLFSTWCSLQFLWNKSLCFKVANCLHQVLSITIDTSRLSYRYTFGIHS